MKKFNRFDFFKVVLGSQQSWAESTEISHTPCAHSGITSHTANTAHQGGENHRLTHCYQSPQLKSGLTLGVVPSIGSDKFIMTCVHHDRITQRSFMPYKFWF